MNTRSRKNKGKNLQNKIRDILIDEFGLTEEDVKSTTMGESGVDVQLSKEAKKVFPFSIECKNQEKLNVWSSMNQAESNKGDLMPLLVFKRNRTKTYCMLEFEDLIKIMKNI